MVSSTRNYGLVTSDLLASAEWISIWRCTLVYTLLQSPPAWAIIVSVMFGVSFDTVWFAFFFFHLESNFFNRLSYQMHQDMGSLSVASCCIARIACSLISSKTFLWPYVLVISLWETVWLDQDMWSNLDTLVWPGPCTTRITIDLDEKVNWFWLI